MPVVFVVMDWLGCSRWIIFCVAVERFVYCLGSLVKFFFLFIVVVANPFFVGDFLFRLQLNIINEITAAIFFIIILKRSFP